MEQIRSRLSQSLLIALHLMTRALTQLPGILVLHWAFQLVFVLLSLLDLLRYCLLLPSLLIIMRS